VDIPEIFKNLKPDTWYKALVYFGSSILVVAFFLDVKGITNTQLQLLSGGALVFGLGVWANETKEARIKPPNVYTGGPLLITRTFWSPGCLGLIFNVIGVGLLVLGVWSIVKALVP